MDKNPFIKPIVDIVCSERIVEERRQGECVSQLNKLKAGNNAFPLNKVNKSSQEETMVFFQNLLFWKNISPYWVF